jgi:acetate kinase
MDTLVINTGSASIKLAAYDVSGPRPRPAHSAHLAPDEGTPDELLGRFCTAWGHTPDAVCHRVVHGGNRLRASCRITREVRDEIARLGAVAPLHNPVALCWIEAAGRMWGADVPQVAVFDTAFYADLPEWAARYALPGGLDGDFALRRYGFHGIAHRAMWERWCRLRPDLPAGGRLISIQLGGGCSMTATRNGLPQDTSMGFSPTEGLVMASRSGDVDPGVITFLMRNRGMSADQIDHLLNEASGLKGLSNTSGDIRTLLDSDRPDCRLAVELYCYRVMKYLGAYLAVMGGADGIVFGGGVGEHAVPVRERILSDMEWCGILLDTTANAAVSGTEGRISEPASDIEIWVTPVDEQTILAQEAHAVLKE